MFVYRYLFTMETWFKITTLVALSPPPPPRQTFNLLYAFYLNFKYAHVP